MTGRTDDVASGWPGPAGQRRT